MPARRSPTTTATRTLALALACASGCGRHTASDPNVLRIGYLPNVTHEVALSAARRGTFERALAPVAVEWKAFGAGPALMEALFAGALDAGYVGPGPAENGYLRSGGQALVIVAGAASGGAALVVRAGLGIRGPSDLHGRTLASPQLGNTQDVALRSWLADQGLRTTDEGGDVRVMPIANSAVPGLMKRGDLDGAWVPEPWVTLLRQKLGAELLVDERTLWPGGRFATVELVAARDALAKKRDAFARLVAAHVDEIRFLRDHPDEGRRLVGEQLAATTGKKLPEPVLAASLATITPTWDPMPDVLARLAAQARRLTYLPAGDLSGLVDRSLLDAALAARHLEAAP